MSTSANRLARVGEELVPTHLPDNYHITETLAEFGSECFVAMHGDMEY